VATASGAIVVTVRYRLAPEHDLYAGRDDCMAALEWAAREGAAHGIDGTRLAVGGDSAGANIAAAVAQRARAQGGPALRLQALVYPATNLRDPFPSKDENSQGFLLTAEGMEAIKELFCSANPDLGDPLLSPGLSKDLKNLPPAVIVTAGFDPIRDDGLNYVSQLRDAGVPVELLHYAGQFHGFINFDGVMRAARDALDRIGAALKQALQAMPEGKPPVALDRTLEIEQKPKVTQIPALSLGRNMLIASLMAGERLEGLRTDVMQRLLPKGGRLSAMWASPLMNPVTTYRAQVAQMYAAMDVRETYSGAARRTTAAAA
jgi:acetyl esterase